MRLDELERAVLAHRGEFHCAQIRDEKNSRLVPFLHLTTPAVETGDLPDIGKLREFYVTFGSIRFYCDQQSGDSARYLAPVSEWPELQDSFMDWIDPLDDDETDDEFPPPWVRTCLVIGETPRSGNYILMPTEGQEAGQVWEFDHDGYEFNFAAKDLVEYVERMMAPDGARLTDFASSMRFIEGDRSVQWWIEELRDNQGRVVSTHS
ncbi:SMI1/KNR4 family protein [Pseudoduganella violaceinigra]|uniref:SMI1/KNR4 family protein n=1 Tax=Pseudoduganella violaceinigra TaxID=246602 RepID=UPI000411D575|nr:SMI1/KNR4 family protein [Pseudoduganella violaceinigra]